MNVVYLLDPKTQVGYALDTYETSQEALNRKDRLRVDYPNSLFYYRINEDEPELLYDVEEALRIVNGN